MMSLILKRKEISIMEKFKIINLILLVIIVVAILLGCDTKAPVDSESNTIGHIGLQEETTSSSEQTTSSQGIEGLPEYGIFQEVVDSYGFPFYLRYTEGMSLTKIYIFEDNAEREWIHSLEDPAHHDNLTWELKGNTLEISGDWNESFTVNMDTGIVTSLSDGKEYRLIVYDENGDGHGYVE